MTKKTLAGILGVLRGRRGFEVKKYIKDKTLAINDFFRAEGLNSVVVGLSGGVDSSVVLALLLESQKQKGSPLKNIRGVIIPIYGDGTSGQEAAASKAVDFVQATTADWILVDGTPSYQSIVDQSPSTDAWARGQLASIVRTPILYFQAATMQQQGLRSLICGTVNRDEGGFIGFFGKASDAAVDLQPIADIHKSEVYQVARELNVPDFITNDKPRGDVHNNLTDEELMGFSYDELEVFTLLNDVNALSGLSEKELSEGRKFMKKPEVAKMIARRVNNSHKYLATGLGFGRFIDVLPRVVAGGWR